MIIFLYLYCFRQPGSLRLIFKADSTKQHVRNLPERECGYQEYNYQRILGFPVADVSIILYIPGIAL